MTCNRPCSARTADRCDEKDKNDDESLNSLSACLELRADLAELLGDVLLGLDLRLEVVLQLQQGHLVQLLRPPVLPVFLRGSSSLKSSRHLHNLHLFCQLTSKGLK